MVVLKSCVLTHTLHGVPAGEGVFAASQAMIKVLNAPGDSCVAREAHLRPHNAAL